MKLKKAKPEYKQVFASSPLIVSKEFSLWAKDNNGQKLRYGTIVKKKQINKASLRNKAKRMAKGVLVSLKNQLFYQDKDVVLVVKLFEQQKARQWKTNLQTAYLWLDHVIKFSA